MTKLNPQLIKYAYRKPQPISGPNAILEPTKISCKYQTLKTSAGWHFKMSFLSALFNKKFNFLNFWMK